MSSIASFRASLLAASLLMLAPLAAQAAPVLVTGTPNGDQGDDPAYDDVRVLGATFTLTQATHITDIGFGADPNSQGTVFGAIVPVDAVTGFPTATYNALEATALAWTTITMPAPGGTATDVFGTLSLDLAPGTYGVVFGTGQFGTDAGDFAAFETAAAVGSPRLFDSFFGSDWETFDQDALRILVDGNPVRVPEPMTLALMGAGLAGAAALRRKRKA